MDDPLTTVYALVERAYLRLQAGDLLMRCLEEETATPVKQFIDGLVMAGPKSLATLREVLAEAEERRSQVRNDLQQIILDLKHSLESYGLHIEETGRRELPVALLSPLRVAALLRETTVDEETSLACLRLLRESRSLIENAAARLQVLEEAAAYAKDWLWGLTFESVHSGESERRAADNL